MQSCYISNNIIIVYRINLIIINEHVFINSNVRMILSSFDQLNYCVVVCWICVTVLFSIQIWRSPSGERLLTRGSAIENEPVTGKIQTRLTICARRSCEELIVFVLFIRRQGRVWHGESPWPNKHKAGAAHPIVLYTITTEGGSQLIPIACRCMKVDTNFVVCLFISNA